MKKFSEDVSALPQYTDEVGGELVRKPVLASLPLFENKEDAEALAEVMGCKGSHEHKYGDVTLYMPCEKHPEDFASQKISIDYDDTLSTDRGFKTAERLIKQGMIVYIISARNDKEGMLKRAAELGIPESRVFATGSNKAKVEKVKELGVEKHYDNNEDVIKELGDVGVQFAEIGPRGGINKSDKAPKSKTPNEDPKGEGTAKGDASGKRGAKVTVEQENTLQKKVDDFNEKDSNTKNGRATLGALKSVFQRGLGAYNVSHSPKVQSPEQWAYARVNAFLYLLKNGRPENAKYKTDYDLLPKGHPKYNMSINIEIECEECGWEWNYEDGGVEPFICHKCGYDNTPTEIDEDGSYTIGEFASYDDYPALIRKNAQAALDYIEKTGNPRGCMTQVGKVRAQQLAQGKPISIETVKRMKAYITRHKKDLQVSKSYDDGCGKLAMDAWGGVEALSWVESTIKKNEEMSSQEEMTFSVFNSEQRLVVGAAMIPDKMIIRRNEITGEIYYVYFTAETIKKLQQKFMQEKLLDKTNIEHGRRFLNGVDVVESWIVEDPQKDKQQVFGMDYPKGTWMCIVKVDDENTWQMVKDGKLRGFSVQGYFLEKAKFNSHTHHVLDEIKQILNEVR